MSAAALAMRQLAQILVAAWLGAALLVATVVAPAAFAVLPTRTLAGALVGRVLPPLFLSGIVAGALAGIAAWRDRSAMPDARFTLARLLLGAAVVVACVAAQFVVAPRIEAVRARIGPSVDSLERGDPRRVAFGRLHGISVAALGVAMLAGAAAVALGALPTSRGGAAPVPAGERGGRR